MPDVLFLRSLSRRQNKDYVFTWWRLEFFQPSFFMERGDNSMSDDGLIEIWLLDKRIHEERMKEIKEKEQV